MNYTEDYYANPGVNPNENTPETLVMNMRKSCCAYYNHLKKHNLGYVRILVINFKILETCVKFKLDDTIKHPEGLILEINGNDYPLNAQTPYDFYDNDQKVLIRSVSEETLDCLAHSQNDRIYIKSSMLFLVKRLWDRYSDLNQLFFPFIRPSLNVPSADSLHTPPSEEQSNALKMIFCSPMSYIWGAPGTGKTKYVLANSIIHYIKHGRQILITAPTNNAIEQVLFTVLDTLKTEGLLKPKTVVRLGLPSTKFATAYPDYCENVNLKKRVDALKKQIDILNNALEAKTNEQEVERMLDAISLINKLKDIAYITINKNRTILNKENSIDWQKRTISVLESKLAETRYKYEHSIEWRNTFWGKLFLMFRKTPMPETPSEIAEIPREITVLNNKIEELLAETALLENEISEAIKTSTGIIQKLSPEYADMIKEQPHTQKYIKHLDDVISQIKKSANLKTLFCVEFCARHNEYISMSIDEIKERLSYHNEQLKILQSQKLQARIDNANVIACTIDTLTSRVFCAGSTQRDSTFNGEPLYISPSHIFVDEAAYCSIVKIPLLFSFDCPITMLGDHMQLPPVTEIGKTDDSNVPEYQAILLWTISGIYVNALKSQDIPSIVNKYLYHNEKPSFIDVAFLTKTYRYGTTLTKVLDKYIYKFGLTSYGHTDTAVYYVDAPPTLEVSDKRISLSEVSAIKNLFSTKQINSSDFAILTPYNAQAAKLKDKTKTLFDRSHIMTVHKSQGYEWDIVILSVVDSRCVKKWFASSRIPKSQGLQLINTAVSRARKQLILVLDKRYWETQNNELLTELLKIAEPLNITTPTFYNKKLLAEVAEQQGVSCRT